MGRGRWNTSHNGKQIYFLDHLGVHSILIFMFRFIMKFFFQTTEHYLPYFKLSVLNRVRFCFRRLFSSFELYILALSFN